MVKPDVSRDYYADLELKPGADISEIKKAYKKLALKYHPDRNQGREAEFIPKFQAVNVAHEILSDPVAKAKYDADRAKAGYRSAAYNPARPTMPQRNGWNPPASASYYNPPPPPPPQARPPFNPTSSAGATRFAKYTEAYQKGRQAKTAQEAANSKVEAFKAWEKMKPSVPMNNRFEQQTPPPRAAESGYKTPPNRAATPNAFDQGYSRRFDEQFPDQTKTRRKGWAPDAPGDEPPAQNTSAYASIHRSNTRPQTSRSQTVPDQPPRPAPTAKKPDPLARFRAEAAGTFGETERVSAPYASTGGERTYFNSSTLNRSASTREGVHRAASNLHHTERRERSPPSAHRRHRSVSASRHRRQSVSSDSDKMAASPQDPFDPHRKESGRGAFTKSYRTTQERTGTSGKSNETHNKNQQGKSAFTTPYVESDSSEDEHQFRPFYRSKRSEEKPPNARRRSRTIIDLTGDSSPENEKSANRNFSAQQKKPGPSPLETFTQKMANAELNDSAGKSQRPASATGFKASGAPFEYARSSLSSSIKPTFGTTTPMGGSPRLFKWLTDPDLYLTVATANCKIDYSFAVPQPFAYKPPAGADLRSRSTEEINAKFFSGEWTGKFEENLFSRPPPAGRQRSPRRGQGYTRGRSQTRPTGPPQAPTPPTQDDFLKAKMPPPNPTQPAPNWKPVRFSPDDWVDTVKQPLFSTPPPNPTSPVRATPLGPKRSNPRMKTSRPPSTPAPRRGGASKTTSLNATVGSDDEETSAYDRSGSKSAESSSSRSSGGGSAMDIDPTMPAQQKQQPHGLPPRPTYVQHPGATVGTPQTAQPSQISTRRASSTMPPPPPRAQAAQQTPAPPVTPRQAQPSASTTQGTTPGVQHPVVDLTDLKNCEPFAFPNNGLQGMKAMSSNLPYEPRAASTTTPLTPENLNLPKPPRAPTAPSNVTGENWPNYLNRMIPYVREWQIFNDKMLKHFTARQAEVEGLAPKWLEVAGEPLQGGLLKYVKGLDEDTQVREHWNVACEKHHEAMKTFCQIKKGVLEHAAMR